MAEILQGHHLLGIVRDQMGGLGHMAIQEERNCIAADAATLFQNTTVHPPLDLKKDGCVRIIVVKAEPELKSVLVTVDRGPIKLQVVRIEVEAVNRIREVWFANAVLVQFEVGLNKLAKLQCGVFGNDVLLLPAGGLEFILRHNYPNDMPKAANAAKPYCCMRLILY